MMVPRFRNFIVAAGLLVALTACSPQVPTQVSDPYPDTASVEAVAPDVRSTTVFSRGGKVVVVLKPLKAYYKNCDEAIASGAAPMYQGKAGYRRALDKDRDGVACELESNGRPEVDPSVETTTTAPVYYASCEIAKAANDVPLFAGEAGYREALDPDGDGIACEADAIKLPPSPSPSSSKVSTWNVVSNGEGGHCRYIVEITKDGQPITSAEGITISAHRKKLDAWVSLPGPSLWTPIPGAVVTSICGLWPVDMIRVSYLGTTQIRSNYVAPEQEPSVPTPTDPTPEVGTVPPPPTDPFTPSEPVTPTSEPTPAPTEAPSPDASSVPPTGE